MDTLLKKDYTNSIFLPAAGDWNNTDILGMGSYGFYWSSSRLSGIMADSIIFDSEGAAPSIASRWNGLAVRPVCE